MDHHARKETALTNTNPAPRDPTIADPGAFTFISTEHDIVVGHALTTTPAAAGLITVILGSWSHFRFPVVQVPTWAAWAAASRVHHVVLVLEEGRGARFPLLLLWRWIQRAGASVALRMAWRS